MRYYFKNIDYITQVSKKIIKELNNIYNVDELNIKNVLINIEKELPERKYKYSLNKIRDILSLSLGYNNFKEMEKIHNENKFTFEDDNICFYFDDILKSNHYFKFEEKDFFQTESYRKKIIHNLQKYLLKLKIKDENTSIIATSLSNLIYTKTDKLSENFVSIYNIINLSDKIELEYFIQDIISDNYKSLHDNYSHNKYKFIIHNFLNFSYINIYINKNYLFHIDSTDNFLSKSDIIIINNNNYKNSTFNDLWVTRYNAFIKNYLDLIFIDNYIKKISFNEIIENLFNLEKLIETINNIDPEKKHSIHNFILCLPSNDLEIKQTQFGYVTMFANELIHSFKHYCVNKNIKHIPVLFKNKEKMNEYYSRNISNQTVKYFLDNKPPVAEWNIETSKEFLILVVHFFSNYDINYKDKNLNTVFNVFEILKARMQ